MRGLEFLCAVLLLTGAGLLSNRQQALADAVSIYKCEVGGVLTFSDRPCSSEAELHELDETAVNTYDAPPVAPNTAETKARARKTVTRQAETQPDKRAETCARVGRSMKEVRSKMRAGYSAKEGERLRERLAKLKGQQREYRCS
ncbi:MAG TPA: hypothetical protein VNA21_10370 [Steroidobacteraceae bacterium]|nr:hypothetical protein [Steroidobacteraceae bacterium]